MRRSFAALAAAPLLLLLSAAAPSPAARFTADGALVPPVDYREWVYLSSGLDMSYSDAPAMAGMSMFDNVFVDPAAWAAFKASGHWPEGTVFILENRGGDHRGSINKKGTFQSAAVMGLEAHVKDVRFKGGWGFFDLSDGKPAKQIPYEASCYSCHQAHGAVETTFAQFYPTAKPIAVKAGTYEEK
jgi:hypothetical protein